MRLFISSSFEPAFVSNLKAVAAYARDNAGRDAVKWVDPSSFHITYAFLGEVGQKDADAAAEAMDSGLEGVAPFRIVSGGFGVFPSPRHPGVLWLGIAEGAAELCEAARRLARGLKAKNLVFEDRFEPHVTLGRVKGTLPENFLRRVGDFSADKRVSSLLSSVELMESRLTPEGPVYRRVFSSPLAGAKVIKPENGAYE